MFNVKKVLLVISYFILYYSDIKGKCFYLQYSWSNLQLRQSILTIKNYKNIMYSKFF